MKKTKLLLPVLTLSMLGTAIGGGCLVAAAAEPQARDGVTVGAFHTWDPYTFNGTEANDGKTTISYKWTSAAGYTSRVTVTGYTSGDISLSLTSQNDAKMRLALISVGGWDLMGTDVIATDTVLTAGTEYTYTGNLATNLNDGATDFDLLFYFDANTEMTEKNVVTVNTLTVGGVSYQATEYTAPLPEVTAPEKSFKENSAWVATNGTVSANTLEKLQGDEAADAVDNASGNFTITDVSKPALLEIPLSESLAGWPEAWSHYHLKVKQNNVTEINVYIETRAAHEGEEDDAHAFGFLKSGSWNVTIAKSVSEGYLAITVDLSTFFTGYLAAHEGASISKIVLEPIVKDGASEASIEIGGMTFGGKTAPTFINDIGTPEIGVSGWLSWDGYTLAEEGSLEVEGDKTYTGTKVTYNSEIPANASFYASVTNFDATQHSSLHIGFYTDSDITLAIGADWTALTGHETYAKGYHEVDLDYSTITGESFLLRFWADSAAKPDFEGTKNIVIDTIIFYKDEVSIALDEASTNGLFKKPTVTDGKLSWSWDAKDAGAFYAVSVPVDGWYPYQRSILHVNVTLSHDTAFGIWGKEAFTDNVLQNSTHPKLAAGTYDLWLDSSSTKFEAGGMNSVMFYCDVNNPSAASLIKTVTINSIEFVKTAAMTSSPNASALTVNYTEQKVTFGDTVEVSTAADFATKLESGATVTPGATLYLRAADGTSGTTVITLPATELTKETAPEATVGSNYIRFGSTDYEYKFGENGEWVALGSWGNLASDTEFTIYVRVKATETSFASNVVELKIKTTAGTTTTPDDNTDNKDGDKEEKKGCFSVIGLGGIGLAALAAMAVGTVVIAKKKKD